MDIEAPKRELFWLRYTQHMLVSILVAAFLTLICIFGLYAWAKSLGTCVHRPAFTLLSMLEQLVPWFMHPIQSLVCSH